MNSTKIFIALLLLIGILFVVGINLGAFHTDNQSFQTPSWVQNFGAALTQPQQLQLADLSSEPANCLQRGDLIVQAATTCSFALKKSAFSTRVIRLQLLQGSSATVALSQEDTLTVRETILGNAVTQEDFKVYPGKSQGKLTLQCNDSGGGTPCLFGLK
ncbi:MAG TPA: hypothetical protein VGD98_03360 [Ktedonobacteraceae bacterium]